MSTEFHETDKKDTILICSIFLQLVICRSAWRIDFLHTFDVLFYMQNSLWHHFFLRFYFIVIINMVGVGVCYWIRGKLGWKRDVLFRFVWCKVAERFGLGVVFWVVGLYWFGFWSSSYYRAVMDFMLIVTQILCTIECIGVMFIQEYFIYVHKHQFYIIQLRHLYLCMVKRFPWCLKMLELILEYWFFFFFTNIKI